MGGLDYSILCAMHVMVHDVCVCNSTEMATS